MSKYPEQIVAYAAEHTELDLCVFGIGRRKLAESKVRSLAAAKDRYLAQEMA